MERVGELNFFCLTERRLSETLLLSSAAKCEGIEKKKYLQVCSKRTMDCSHKLQEFLDEDEEKCHHEDN